MKRIFNTLALALLCCLTASAGDNKLSIANFQIIPGEEKTLEVVLTNEDNISSLQFDMAFPEGLSYVDGSLSKVTARITRSSHSIIGAEQDDGTYRFGVLSTSASTASSAIKGNSGAILTMKVKADESFAGGNIQVTEIIGSDATVDTPVRIDMSEFQVKAGLYVGTMDVDVKDVALKSGDTSTIYLLLNNTVTLSALQAKITLPEGIEFDTDADGENVTYTDRLSDNHVATINLIPGTTNEYMLVISALTGDDFDGNEGNLIGLNIKANDEFEGGNIVIKDVIVSNKLAIRYDMDATLTVSCAIVDGIDSVWQKADGATCTDIYTLGGARVNTVEKGKVYILRYSDGATRKVIVK